QPGPDWMQSLHVPTLILGHSMAKAENREKMGLAIWVLSLFHCWAHLWSAALAPRSPSAAEGSGHRTSSVRQAEHPCEHLVPQGREPPTLQKVSAEGGDPRGTSH
uniref:Uncharacterized protein n=1 Tax=Melopsittacus undulatus TaxID=13146 RepID=A0A8V5GN38_MELUD